MAREAKRPLKVFLCHASGDKPPVRDLYKRLTMEGVDAWLDKEKLLPGQDWQVEIPRAVREADVVVVCLSNRSVTKEGYVQKEIKFALDIAEEKPEGTIFLIPARLEDCPVPERLNRWQWVDLYEENGFIQLLRSLKLRAGAVGAVIEAVPYEDTDKERAHRLNQLYTEGLEAFYTEDWDRACRRFQAILSEQPNHKNAAEKLEEAQCQGHYAKLYSQATEDYRSENWIVAIPALEELTEKAPNYKDAAQLLRDARKREQLAELYEEAKTLHTAQKWQAVVKVFEQISIIEPGYPDADGLLASAQKEVAELKRLSELNEQYSQALHEMESANWYEARRLLEGVHKSQTGFMETEKLLRKVENEILKEGEKRRQNEQIEILYEQAHGLLRSKKWRNALEKMGEIRQLDDHFPDADGIAEQAQRELVREELEAERQNKLAALYAEAVKLSKEEKYREALDKWGEVRAIDTRYPDRQRVQKAARKAITKQAKPIAAKFQFIMPKSLWIWLGCIVAIAVLVFAINQLGGNENKAPLAPTIFTTDIVAENTAFPVSSATNIPQITNTTPSTTPIAATSGYADPTMYDDFDNRINGESYNKALWDLGGSVKNMNGDTKSLGINQKDGKLLILVNGQIAVGLDSAKTTPSDSQIFSEVRVFLDPNTIDNSSILYVVLGIGPGGAGCQIIGLRDNKQDLNCSTSFSGDLVGTEVLIKDIAPTWHTIRLEYNAETVNFSYFFDGNYIGSTAIPLSSVPADVTDFPKGNAYVGFGINNSGPSTAPVGYFDYVRMGAIEDDPNIYFFDEFDDPEFDGALNTNNWGLNNSSEQVNGKIFQESGALVFTQANRGYQSVSLKENFRFVDNKSIYIETNLKMEKGTVDDFLILSIDIDDLRIECNLHGMSDGWFIGCHRLNGPEIFNQQVEMNQEHILRVEVAPQKTDVMFFVDEIFIDAYQAGRDSKDSTISILLQSLLSQANFYQLSPLRGYVYNVRIGILDTQREDSP